MKHKSMRYEQTIPTFIFPLSVPLALLRGNFGGGAASSLRCSILHFCASALIVERGGGWVGVG